jgi:hypothetical protein
MKQWMNARSAKLLQDLNDTPFTDDCDDIKLNLIRGCMREISVEMFQRAAENSRKEIDKLQIDATNEAVSDVVKRMEDITGKTEFDKPEEKIQLKSSIVRRKD